MTSPSKQSVTLQKKERERVWERLNYEGRGNGQLQMRILVK